MIFCWPKKIIFMKNWVADRAFENQSTYINLKLPFIVDAAVRKNSICNPVHQEFIKLDLLRVVVAVFRLFGNEVWEFRGSRLDVDFLLLFLSQLPLFGVPLYSVFLFRCCSMLFRMVSLKVIPQGSSRPWRSVSILSSLHFHITELTESVGRRILTDQKERPNLWCFPFTRHRE